MARRSFVICLSEIWKTTPFISLLLLAGLAQVPDELQEAAKVDGATWWQRLCKVTLPNMKAAIMVAVLFRTLDAFRIFDNIFVMTGGANGTESVSFLAYRQTIGRLEIGLGLGGVGAAVPLRRADQRRRSSRASRSTWRRPEGTADGQAATRASGGSSAACVIVLYALFPVAWIVSLSFKAPARPHQRAVPARRTWTWDNYDRSSPATRSDLFLPALRNSFGICLIATLISVLPGHVRAPTPSPGWTSRASG